jgi:hypothetical protein
MWHLVSIKRGSFLRSPVLCKTQRSSELQIQDILCCEYRSHAVIFTLTNGEEIISRTIRESFAEYSSPILYLKQAIILTNSYFYIISHLLIKGAVAK